MFNINHFIISQVEPFVMPFLYDNTKPTSLLLHAQRLLLHDMKFRMKKLVGLNVLPSEMHDIAKQAPKPSWLPTLRSELDSDR